MFLITHTFEIQNDDSIKPKDYWLGTFSELSVPLIE